MTLWVDGRLVDDESSPVLRADDHGITVGDGVFETMKVVDGRPFAISRHLERLTVSAAGLGIPLDLAQVRAGIDAVLAADPAGRARLRVTVTGGPSPYGSDRGQATPTLVIATAPLTDWPPTTDVVTVPWTRNERAATAGMKTTSYADNVVALRHAHDRGAAEAIFANTRGELCEGTGTNVFVGVAGRLLTPPLDSGCLAGVTRALLVEWLGDVGEERMPLSALADAEEAFLASSTRDVQPIRAVDGRQLPACPGPLTRRAAEVFASRSQAEADP
ncbi:MAG TPA: aminotransferase class IV [Mycobacteriales bacterium]|nr:aminotransferase class IV [Mycobacteriales bacterium]